MISSWWTRRFAGKRCPLTESISRTMLTVRFLKRLLMPFSITTEYKLRSGYGVNLRLDADASPLQWKRSRIHFRHRRRNGRWSKKTFIWQILSGWRRQSHRGQRPWLISWNNLTQKFPDSGGCLFSCGVVRHQFDAIRRGGAQAKLYGTGDLFLGKYWRIHDLAIRTEAFQERKTCRYRVSCYAIERHWTPCHLPGIECRRLFRLENTGIPNRYTHQIFDHRAIRSLLNRFHNNRRVCPNPQPIFGNASPVIVAYDPIPTPCVAG